MDGLTFCIEHEHYRAGRLLGTRRGVTKCAAKAYGGLEEHLRYEDHKWSLGTEIVDL